MAAAEIETVSEWNQWVSPSAMRNHVMGTPLLDWLDLYGTQHDFTADEIDERTDFGTFAQLKGRQFEQAVLRHLVSLNAGKLVQVVDPDASDEERHSDDAVEATLSIMQQGVPFISQGALRHSPSQTFGLPDLLVRSDTLAALFPATGQQADATVSASGLGLAECHYVIVDVKFATLHLAAGGDLAHAAHLAHRVETCVYNRALADLQEYLPPYAYILGRGWTQTKKSVTTKSDSCMDLLGPVQYASDYKGSTSEQSADQAAAWVRRLRSEGSQWAVTPSPSVPELRPNAKAEHGKWKSAVANIVSETEDLTQLWQVGPAKRDAAVAQGFERWSDPAVTPAVVSVNGPSTAPKLQAMLDVNRGGGEPVRPGAITAAHSSWRASSDLEFFVDYETVNTCNDDFASLPQSGGLAMIFMIGCGHIENKEWQFSSFTADDLTKQSERQIVRNWFAHMDDVRQRTSPAVVPRVFHWSAHEVTSLNAASDSEAEQAADPDFEWFDILSEIVRPEPVVVRGSHGFGLKDIATALHHLGLIDVSWDSEGPSDGLTAMVGAWWCQGRLDDGAVTRLDELQLMQQIRSYNEMDCKSMMAIMNYLRQNH